MKKIQYALLTVATCFIAFLFSSCGGGAKQAEATNDSTRSESTAAGETIYLEGMYATSTLLPMHDNALENIFDNNPGTHWSTAVGAGPDEGFMLYFPNATYVKEIMLTPASGSSLASIKRVAVFADGQPVGDGDWDPAKAITVDKELTAIFIKIDETDNSSDVPIESGDAESTSLDVFDSKFSVGISELKISGKDGDFTIKPPVSLAGTVTASSVLKPADAYAPSQLFDSRKEFVWAEGSKGAGENEKITFTFGNDQNISSVKIWNGYQRSEKHFTSNARIKSFEFGLKGGNKTKYNMEDSMEPQLVEFSAPLKGKELELTILEVYPGKDYKDLVVSEIVFFDGPTPLLIKDNTLEQTVKSVMAQVKGSILEQYVDRRLKNKLSDPEFTTEKSLILRSNKTFVLYNHTSSSDAASEEEKEIVADGNWEVIEQAADHAKVRIFGKLFNLQETTDYYKGDTSSEIVKIFQDNLEITQEEVAGEKYVDSFYNKAQ